MKSHSTDPVHSTSGLSILQVIISDSLLQCLINIAILCLKLILQVLDNDVNDKYKTVEILIAKKTVESADAQKKAEALQNEAKVLLHQATSKLQLLRGKKKSRGFCFRNKDTSHVFSVTAPHYASLPPFPQHHTQT